MKTLTLALLIALAAARPALSTSGIVAQSPCGTSAAPPPAWEHVIWIWFENHSYGSIIHAPDAPFMNELARECGLATNYHNITHPSLPNYIAATSGLPPGALARFRSDCNAVGRCRSRATSIFAQASSWGAYAESMVKPCQPQFKAPYAASHNPAVYYRGLTDCAEHDVGMGRLQEDLAAGTLPAFVSITPNMCHSMHSCAVRTGDAWLAKLMSALLASPAYQAGTTAIFVTFDEGNDGGSNRCATNVHDQGCHIPLIVVSPSTPAG